MQDVVILAAARTPMGSFLGGLSSLSAPKLGACAIAASLQRASLPPEAVEHVLMGNVLQAGLGQAPARQAALGGGVLARAGAVTVSKVCGSGMRAVMDAANAIRTGEYDVAVAGGMESMSNAPHLLERSRQGYRMGEVTLTDSMIKDGLWDPYSSRHMGSCAEDCAQKFSLSREAQDAYAKRSYERAQAAAKDGRSAKEIIEVAVPQKRGDPLVVSADEEPFSAPLEKMAQLRPAFDKAGTITAANASKLTDGAAALVVMSAQRAEDLGKAPLVRIVAYGSTAQEPGWFTTAPIEAIKLVLARASLTPADIHRWEINEAFAVVPMAAMAQLQLDAATVNVRGGAIALGHPLGASGARVLTTLIHTLVDDHVRYGLATLCIGGGEAVAMVVENLTL
jgi:acetyl-CoA C-acetyltransferase